MEQKENLEGHCSAEGIDTQSCVSEEGGRSPKSTGEPFSKDVNHGEGFTTQPITFQRSEEGGVYIGKDVLRRMSQFLQVEDDSHEAGGLLMGRYLIDSKDVVVDAITIPKPCDLRSRRRFERRDWRHQAKLEEEWASSSQTCTYLGEWHTHPELHPSPSRTDFTNWIRKLREDDFGSHLFFLILGSESVAIWEGKSRSTSVTRLKKY